MSKESLVSSERDKYTGKLNTRQDGRFYSLALRALGTAALILSPLIVACAPDAKAISPLSTPEPARATATATAEAQNPPTPEVKKEIQCSFFSDQKYCGLAEVFETTTPTGKIKAIGVKYPDNPEVEIEIVSPIDGWLQPILNNPRKTNISTEKDTVVDGWTIEGFEFNPTGSAEATSVKKGTVIGKFKRTDFKPLPFAPQYGAYLLPKGSNIDELISQILPGANQNKPTNVVFQASPTKYEQGPVILK